MNDKPMTVKDWEWLAIIAERESRIARRNNAHETHAYYVQLADKCRTRADALHEGRVMP